MVITVSAGGLVVEQTYYNLESVFNICDKIIIYIYIIYNIYIYIYIYIYI